MILGNTPIDPMQQLPSPHMTSSSSSWEEFMRNPIIMMMLMSLAGAITTSIKDIGPIVMRGLVFVFMTISSKFHKKKYSIIISSTATATSVKDSLNMDYTNVFQLIAWLEYIMKHGNVTETYKKQIQHKNCDMPSPGEYYVGNGVSCHIWPESVRSDPIVNSTTTTTTLCVSVETASQYAMLKKLDEDILEEYFETQTYNVPQIFTLSRCKGGLSAAQRGSEKGRLEWSCSKFTSTRRFEHMWFDGKDEYIQQVLRFLKGKDDYIKRGDPYTFGVMLQGPPGCGKTSVVKAIANLCNDNGEFRHIFVIPSGVIKTPEDLNTVMFGCQLDFKHGQGHYSATTIPLDKRIYVFDDIDASMLGPILKPRANIANVQEVQNVDSSFVSDDDNNDGDGDDDDNKNHKGKKRGEPNIDLANVLEALDGIVERTGEIIIFSTNKKDLAKEFDPAFLRPGRIDKIISMTACTHEGIASLVNGFFGTDIPVDRSDIQRIPEYTYTPADVKEMCKTCSSAKEALAMLFEKLPSK
jgi:hypothetical protein